MDSCVISPLDREMIQVLECFRPLKSSTLINREQGDVFMGVSRTWNFYPFTWS